MVHIRFDSKQYALFILKLKQIDEHFLSQNSIASGVSVPKRKLQNLILNFILETITFFLIISEVKLNFLI